ncbi:MAG TPA: DUF5955 family protein [Thermopolyspora sp.]|jgi:hypothetical protein
MSTNYGNQVTGGTFHGPAAVGDNATINTFATSAQDEPVRLARELRALIDANAAALDHPERVRRDADDLTEELSRPAGEQDRDRLSDTLKRLAARVTSVTALVEAVTKLRELIFG